MTPAQATCLADAIAVGYGILEQRGSALAAVECATNLLEQSGLFNAGRGAKRQRDGVQRMDAAIMEGAHLKAGAIASIEGIVHPITAARLVMEETGHVLLVGPFAGRFARHFKLDRHHSTDVHRRLSYDRILARQRRSTTEWHGTVGAVALDRSGTVAAGTSTGGINSMLPGRVGDSPLIGCGVYADNRSGAVSMTGIGEGIIRLVMAKYLRSSGYGKESRGRCSTDVARAGVSGAWIGWGLDSFVRRAVYHPSLHPAHDWRILDWTRDSGSQGFLPLERFNGLMSAFCV